MSTQPSNVPVFEVPKGWVRGEPIRFIGTGPRFGCMRSHRLLPIGEPVPDDPVIEFDTADQANAFRKWWFER